MGSSNKLRRENIAKVTFSAVIGFEAIVLFVAASAKSMLIVTDPFADIKTGISVSLLSISVMVEFAAALYICFGRNAINKWFAVTLLFSAFLTISLFRFARGEIDCGCLGSLDIPRWVLPLNGLLAVASMLLVCRLGHPDIEFKKIQLGAQKLLINPSAMGVFAGLAMIASAVLFVPNFREFTDTYAQFGGPTFQKVRYSAGEQLVGQDVVVLVPWRNQSEESVKFIGNQTSCRCIGLVKKNFSVAPDQLIELPIIVRPTGPGFFHQRVICFVDHPEQDRVIIDIVANAIESNDTGL